MEEMPRYMYEADAVTGVVTRATALVDGVATELRLPQGTTTYELDAAWSGDPDETVRRAGLIHDLVREIKADREREIVARAVRVLGLNTSEGR